MDQQRALLPGWKRYHPLLERIHLAGLPPPYTCVYKGEVRYKLKAHWQSCEGCGEPELA